MSNSDANMTVDSVARVTDDETELSTNASKSLSADVLSPDGLYFKTSDPFDSESDDHLTSLHTATLEDSEKRGKNQVEQTNVSDIFELDDEISSNDNSRGNSMGFFGRLYHQLTRPSVSSDSDSFDDEGFTEIDESEITAVINNSSDIDTNVQDDNKAKSNNSILRTIRLFIENVNQETDVITGLIDRETLLNRRSRKAGSLPTLRKNDDSFYNRTTF